MRRHIGLLLLLCFLFAQPLGTMAQRPPSAEQQQQLGITNRQQKELEALFSESRRQRDIAHARLHALYQELQGLYASYEFDQKRAAVIRKEIVAQHLRLLELHADNEVKLRRILNPDQFARLHAQVVAEREKHRGQHARTVDEQGPERSHP